MKKTIRDYELKNKRVIIRVDFNVPIKNGVIVDDTRIVNSLPTIRYALDNDAKIILMSHLGRVKTIDDKKAYTLKPVADYLSKRLHRDVIFIDKTKGMEIETSVNNMKNGDILLMENTRYEDLSGKLESCNNESLGKYWASLGDVFINDAFGTSHRSHASNVGIASNIPNGIGFLIEKELNILEKTINNPKRPFTVILGGSKVSDKIGVIENLVKIADYILIGGGMMFTFLYASGHNIGKSILDIDSVDFCKKIIKNYKDKIILPVDCCVAKELKDDIDNKIVNIDSIENDYMGLDIAHETIKLFSGYLNNSETVIWNGPVGVFEYDDFAYGTKSLCSILASLDATVIIGGGDTASAINKFGYKDAYTHVSTGGGATLELLEGKKLPGIAIIDDR